MLLYGNVVNVEHGNTQRTHYTLIFMCVMARILKAFSLYVKQTKTYFSIPLLSIYFILNLVSTQRFFDFIFSVKVMTLYLEVLNNCNKIEKEGTEI